MSSWGAFALLMGFLAACAAPASGPSAGPAVAAGSAGQAVAPVEVAPATKDAAPPSSAAPAATAPSRTESPPTTPAPSREGEAETSTPAPAAPVSTVALSPRARVEFHLEQARSLTEHFRRRLEEPCPRFATPAEWTRFLDGEIGQAVTLAAHVKEASVIARRSRDEDLVRAAKGPEGHIEEARGVAEKLEACARDNGTTVDFLALAKRVRRELPKRRAEIRLPR